MEFYEDSIYLEIADIANKDEYIKFSIYNSKDKSQIDDDELIPLSNYYYEALQLCISSLPVNVIEFFDRVIEEINKAWFACDNQNKDDIIESVKKISESIRNFVHKYQFKSALFKNSSLSDFDYYNFAINSEIIDRYYDEWAKNNTKLINKFNKNGGGCVALAMPTSKSLCDKENCFLSISGSSKDYIGKIPSFGSISKEVKQTYKSINDLLNLFFGFKFQECHLTDETRRYTYYDKRKKFDRDSTNGNPLKSPIKFSRDYRIRGSSPNFKAHYSCCEKKIISYMNFVNKDYKKLLAGDKVVNHLTSYEFRIKKEPCRMCRPALVGCYFIRSKHDHFYDFILGKIRNGQIKINTKIENKEPLIVV